MDGALWRPSKTVQLAWTGRGRQFLPAPSLFELYKMTPDLMFVESYPSKILQQYGAQIYSRGACPFSASMVRM